MIFLKTLLSLALIAMVAPALANEAAMRDYDASDREMFWVAKIFPDVSIVPCKDVKELSFAECVESKMLVGYQSWKLKRAVNGSAFDSRDSLDYGFIGFLRFSEMPIAEPSRMVVENYARNNIWKDKPLRKSDWSIARQAYIGQQKLRQFLDSSDIYDCLKSHCGKVLRFKARSLAKAAETWRRVIAVRRCLSNWQASDDPKKSKFEFVLDGGRGQAYFAIAAGEIKECAYQSSSDDWLPVVRALLDRPNTF